MTLASLAARPASHESKLNAERCDIRYLLLLFIDQNQHVH